MCAEVIDLEAADDPEEFELVDVHECFRHFNELCFDQTLEAVCVTWSKRLTLSAGRCQFKGRQYCEIRLSEPILKYRSAKECKETLLHEMIHAHLFLTQKHRDVQAHGKEFLWHMQRVNEITGLNVTVRHNFHDEVNYYRRHVWRCSVGCYLLVYIVDRGLAASGPLLRLPAAGSQLGSRSARQVVYVLSGALVD